MKELKKAKKLYIIAITVVLAAAIALCFVYYFAFAWFASSSTVTATGMISSVNASTGLEFTDKVTAVHYKLNGDKIKYTYKIGSKGALSLETKETVNSDKTQKVVFDNTGDSVTVTISTRESSSVDWGTENIIDDVTNNGDGSYTYTVTGDDDATTTYVDYLVNNILPDEFIDVTLKFKRTDNKLNYYSLTLANFATGENNTFTMSSGTDNFSTSKYHTTYGVLPAFKYGVPSAENTGDNIEYKSGSWTDDLATNNSYTFFHASATDSDNDGFYWYTANDYTKDSEYTVKVASGELSDSVEEYTVTFRIREDFDKYYDLLNAATTAGAAYENYLSTKIMQIGQMRLEGSKEATT